VATIIAGLLPAPGFADERSGGQEEPDGIKWLHDLDDALSAAARDGRPVIAYFTFNACVWCKKLEQDTFSDADVIELSRKFVWVKVNRDDTPEIPKQFSVSAYPSLITLGDKREKIYRFQSYQKPPEFMKNLNEALRRHALYRAGKEWDEPEQRPASICANGSVETIKAPSEERPAGIAFLGKQMWVAQGRRFQRGRDVRRGPAHRRHLLGRPTPLCGRLRLVRRRSDSGDRRQERRGRSPDHDGSEQGIKGTQHARHRVSRRQALRAQRPERADSRG
jgi:thiol-disulfide isomerase/thioredoxin